MSDNPDKIVGLFSRLPAEQQNQDIIELLEQLLEKARKGEIIGLGYATTDPGGTLASGWSGVAGSRYPLHSAITLLGFRYAESLLAKRITTT